MSILFYPIIKIKTCLSQHSHLSESKMLNTLTPYLYSITSTICFVTMQVFYKMLTSVLPQSVVLSTQSFFLLCLNSYILVSHEAYHQTYNKYVQNDDKSQSSSEPFPSQQAQTDRRYQIHIKDSHRKLFDKVVFRLLLKRLGINCLGVCVMSMALQSIPLSIVNSLFNTGPIMVFFIQAYFYHKPLSKVHLILTVVSFIGVLIVVNPFNAIEQQKPKFFILLLPLLSAVLASFGFIFLHELKGKINQFVMLQYTYIAQVLVFHLLTSFAATDLPLLQSSQQSSPYFQASITDPYFISAFIISIILSYIANYCRVKSLFLLPPSKVVPLSYIGIVLSLSIDILVFAHQTSFAEILGILLTSVGLLSHLVLELIQNKDEKEKIAN